MSEVAAIKQTANLSYQLDLDNVTDSQLSDFSLLFQDMVLDTSLPSTMHALPEYAVDFDAESYALLTTTRNDIADAGNELPEAIEYVLDDIVPSPTTNILSDTELKTEINYSQTIQSMEESTAISISPNIIETNYTPEAIQNNTIIPQPIVSDSQSELSQNVQYTNSNSQANAGIVQEQLANTATKQEQLAMANPSDKTIEIQTLEKQIHTTTGKQAIHTNQIEHNVKQIETNPSISNINLLKQMLNSGNTMSDESVLQNSPSSSSTEQLLNVAKIDIQEPSQSLTNAKAESVTSQSQAVNTHLSAKITSDTWQQQMAERIHLLTNSNVKAANIQLNPVELGPVRAEIKMVDGQAQIVLSSSHAAVRDAMEAAIPRLREMFTDSNVQLNNVSITDHSAQDQQQKMQQQHKQNAHTWADNGTYNDNTETQQNHTVIAIDPERGLIDYYA